MKKKILFLGIAIAAFAACSIDKQLDDSASNEFKVMMMETADTARWAVPGDTINLKVFASNTSGTLSRIEIIDQNFETNDPISQFTFTCIDTTQQLTIDEEGYFSRAVSTVMAYYPVVIPETPESLGLIYSMTFRVTASDGRTGTATTNFEVINFAVEDDGVSLANCRFYSSANHEVYADSNYMEHLEEIDFVSYLDEDNNWHCLSPSSDKAAEVLADSITNYPQADMLTTRFVIIDKEFEDITEADLDALDFTQGEETLQIENGSVIGYVNSKGRRCIMDVSTSARAMSIESVHDFYIIKPIE